MTGLKILLILLLVIVLLLSLPVGIDAAYEEKLFYLWIRVGAKRFRILPGKFGKKDHKRKNTGKAEEADPSPKGKKKRVAWNIDWDEIKAALDLLIRSVKKLRFQVRRLKLHFISAFPDPYDTAMAYGCANAAANALGLYRVKHGDVRLSADFTGESPVIDAYLSITIRIYYLCKFGFTMVFGVLHLLICHRKRLKQEEKAKALLAGKER